MKYTNDRLVEAVSFRLALARAKEFHGAPPEEGKR
jgi:hypothetical protein